MLFWNWKISTFVNLLFKGNGVNDEGNRESICTIYV